MNNPRFCDLNACGVKVAQEVESGQPIDKDIAAYRAKYLAPYTVGARKGIFVPRELADKLAKTVSLFGNPDLTIGAFVTNILITHLVANRDVINELTGVAQKPFWYESLNIRLHILRLALDNADTSISHLPCTRQMPGVE